MRNLNQPSLMITTVGQATKIAIYIIKNFKVEKDLPKN